MMSDFYHVNDDGEYYLCLVGESAVTFVGRVADPYTSYDGKILRYKDTYGSWWTVRTHREDNESDTDLCDRHDADVAALQAIYPQNANQDGTPPAFLSTPVGI